MKYKKVIQKPYCCMGACLEMILNRKNISNNGQVDIACQLGLIVPESYKNIYKNAIISDKKPLAGYGTQIQKEQFSINNFFRQNNINLTEKYYYIESLEEAKNFLNKNKNSDILICCHCATLYDSPLEDWGHMILFENINNNEVTILDPSSNKNYKTIPFENMIKAITVHGKNNGAGFYLIK